MGIIEDYHGFYDQSFGPAVTRTLDGMLVTANLRRCSAEEARGEGWDGKADGLVSLLNHAWNVYRTSQDA